MTRTEGDLPVSIQIYDVTLRDGFQNAGIARPTVDMKRRIAYALDGFGVSFIEAMSSANPVDREFLKQMQGHELENATLVDFGSTAKIGVNPEDDNTIQYLLESQTKYVTLVGKGSHWQVTDALGATGPENIDTVGRSIEYLKRHGRMVFLDAEHFFDGFKGDPDYSLEVLTSAIEAGADGITLCDTNGGSRFDEVYKITKAVKSKLGDFPIGIHTHNDCELAVANTLAAVGAGAVLIQGTINGYGERTGNANLCTLIPDLVFKYGYDLRVNMTGLTALANFVAKEVKISLPLDAPYVGSIAFAHKGGLHVSAVSKDPSLYEHIQPEWVGNRRVIINSEYGGRSNIREIAKKYGFTLTEEDVRLLSAEMDKRGELGEAQDYLMLHRYCGRSEPFKIQRRKVIDSDESIQAVLKLKVNGISQLVAATGTGSLNAFDNTLKKGISPVFSDINNIRLAGYKVVVPETDGVERYGTDAQVTVFITLSSNGDTWTSVARGDDQDKAAQEALTDGYKYWFAIKNNLNNKSSLNVEPSQVK